MTSGWQLSHHGATAVLLYGNAPLNLFGPEAIVALRAHLDVLADDRDVRAVVLGSSLPDVFGAGLDVRRLPRDEEELDALLANARAIHLKLARLGKPVLAAIDGICYGGALELALACHLRIASRAARLAQPELAFGLVPAGGATLRLPRLVGRGRALRYLLTGRALGAEEAAASGLVDGLVAPGGALDEALRIARRIARLDPDVVRSLLELVHRTTEAELEEGLLREQSALRALLATTPPLLRQRLAAGAGA